MMKRLVYSEAKGMTKYMSRIVHPISPIFNKDSRILILGSFPSVKSREGEFFYHHPQNRFWKVISTLYGKSLPETIEDKRELLIRNRIAVWDVIQSCEITGSADSSIKDVIPNDLTRILNTSVIEHIFTNGGTATKLYKKYILPVTNRESIGLPSTSPANAGCNMDKLLKAWSVILD
jgi:hypoxanthine-DNA glycosylase